ncbi:hypothetical protein Lesp02_54330 [Lentzea sp. NBRC 105346]|uniref:YciI family protein n=1 Tax=Lentzea sp. NBRC 105346 TaxID=3032205 RepID=UPI0024A4FA2B|nr:YciI family protein [Lentzea sp. NBRC 105346]GLZ33245.1 hypothetical protein Lesp02_54330 [Lentzea sp. NBRC 105346]
MARFAVELVYGQNRDERLAARPAHREYIAALVERGVVLLAGPYTDDLGALIVYEADDETAVKEIIAGDPYSSAGVITEWRVHEWNTVLGSLLRS